MPRQAMFVSQHSFNKGEVSPSLHGRANWPELQKGLAKARNVIIRVEGGAMKAPGTKFVAEALDQTRPIRFIPFKFNSEQTYMLEFGEKKFRIYHNGGRVLYPAWHEKAGQVVVIDSPFTLDQMQSLEIRVDAGIRSADYAQENDTLILVHSSISPKILTRYDHHDWKWSEFAPPPPLLSPLRLRITTDGGKERTYIVAALGKDGNGANVESYPGNAVTTAPDDDGGVTTLAWDKVEGATGYRIYREFETGDGWEFRGLRDVSGGDTLTFTDSNIASGNSYRPKVTKNPFHSTGKYPSIAQFDRNRLWMGAPSAQPNQINGSRIGEFKNFDLTEEEDDKEEDIYGGDETSAEDACEWLVSGGDSTPTLLFMASHIGGMMLGARDGEFIMSGEEPAIDPRINSQSWKGGTAIKPLLYNEEMITVSASREKVFAWSFNSIDIKYVGAEISRYSSHIFRGNRVMALAHQYDPSQNIFAVLSNGECAVFTFESREEQIGVTRRVTDGKFETCASVANVNGSTDVYFEVAREVNGVVKRYVEIMAPHHHPGMALDDAWYVDCGIEYRGEAKSTFSGLGHLEGKKISVLADGVDYGCDGNDIVVKGGAFSIPLPAEHVVAGLPYIAEIKTLDLTPQGADPHSRNRVPVTATVAFHHSRDGFVSCEDSEEERIDSFLDPDGETTALKEVAYKVLEIPPDPDGSLSSSITLRSYSPAPWCVMRIDAVVMAAQQHNRRG